GDRERRVSTVGIACGAAGEYLADAARAGCDVFLTGETRFHTCLEARSLGIALVLAGHYATERPAIEWLATHLGEKFPQIEFRSSRVESDPIQWCLFSFTTVRPLHRRDRLQLLPMSDDEPVSQFHVAAGRPDYGTLMSRALQLKCPRCGQGNLFRHWFS